MELNLIIKSNVPVHVHLHVSSAQDDAVLSRLNDIETALTTLTQQQGKLMNAFTDLDATIKTYVAKRDNVDATKDATIADGIQKLKDAVAQHGLDQSTIDSLNAHIADLEKTVADASALANSDIALLTPQVPGDTSGGDTTGATGAADPATSAGAAVDPNAAAQP